MSVKSQFLEKLQTRQPAPVSFTSKTQADIAEFRLRMAQLQEQIEAWLVGTGLNVEAFTVSVTDLLVGGGAFEVQGIILRYENRAITFTPLFLYGQGVTGCVAVNLCAGGNESPLCRLFMRAGRHDEWCCTRLDTLSGPVRELDEETFFATLEGLLP